MRTATKRVMGLAAVFGLGLVGYLMFTSHSGIAAPDESERPLSGPPESTPRTAGPSMPEVWPRSDTAPPESRQRQPVAERSEGQRTTDDLRATSPRNVIVEVAWNPLPALELDAVSVALEFESGARFEASATRATSIRLMVTEEGVVELQVDAPGYVHRLQKVAVRRAKVPLDERGERVLRVTAELRTPEWIELARPSRDRDRHPCARSPPVRDLPGADAAPHRRRRAL